MKYRSPKKGPPQMAAINGVMMSVTCNTCTEIVGTLKGSCQGILEYNTLSWLMGRKAQQVSQPTSALTTAVKAVPITIATAKSTTFPRNIKSRKPVRTLVPELSPFFATLSPRPDLAVASAWGSAFPSAITRLTVWPGQQLRVFDETYRLLTTDTGGSQSFFGSPRLYMRRHTVVPAHTRIMRQTLLPVVCA